MIDKATKGKQEGDHSNQYTGGKVSNVNLAKKPIGHSRQYALRKLRKDAPKLHEKVPPFFLTGIPLRIVVFVSRFLR